MGKRGGLFTGIAGAVRAASLVFCVLLPATVLAQSTDLVPDSPVDHFRVFGFDKTTGWRTWELDGAKAEFPGLDTVRVSDMKIRLFQAGADQKVNLFIESPLAIMSRAKQTVDGPDMIVVTARGLYLCGKNWSWAPDERRLLIRERTHAVITGAVGPILE
jgi:hypothetical protein